MPGLYQTLLMTTYWAVVEKQERRIKSDLWATICKRLWKSVPSEYLPAGSAVAKEPTHNGAPVAPSSEVVLRCQVHRGGEVGFDGWISRLASGVISAPGFAGAMIESKSIETGEREWALTYRFATAEERESWMSSQSYRAALADSSDLFVIPPVEERLDRGERPTATEAVVSVVPLRRAAAYEAARDELDRAAAEFPGFVRIDHHPPSGPRDRKWTTVLAFETGEDLARWRNSEERARGVNRIRKIASDVDKVLPWGFGRWFAVDAATGERTPAWKQAMVVLAVLYAMVSLLNMTLGDYLGTGISVRGDTLVTGLGAQLPVIVFISNLIGTALLTWVLMPVITRVMQWWLHPDASAARTIQGTVLMIAIYALEIAAFTAIYETFRI